MSGLAVTVGIVLALSLGTDTQPAAAAILRHLERQVDPTSGSIIVTRTRITSLGDAAGHSSTVSVYGVSESRGGANPVINNSLTSSPQLGISASVNGNDEIYSAKTNTIYEVNAWAPYIHPGPRRGTYIYRGGQGSPFPGVTVPLTAAQARELRAGRGTLTRPSGHSGWRFLALKRSNEGVSQYIRSELTHHTLHFSGTVELNGQRTYKLTATNPPAEPGGTVLYVNSRTYTPVKLVLFARQSDGVVGPAMVQTWSEWRQLPLTPENERLLSLSSLYPTAQVDHNPIDYRHAARSLRDN